jgi:stage V sporulation protein B
MTGAKLWFLLTGFLQPIFLATALGPTGYGRYGAVLSAISIVNNVVVAGSIQAMSRSVTRYGKRAVRFGLLIHALTGLVVASLLVALAPLIGTAWLRNAELTPMLRLAALITASYCLYAALVGVFNGRQQFAHQAGLDVVFATLRTTLIIVGARSAYGVFGAVAGFVTASVLIVGLAALLLASSKPTPASSDVSPAEPQQFGAFLREYSHFFAPVLLYQIALNMVLQSDVLLMQGVLIRRPGATLEQVTALVGIYKSVQNFAFLPYQILLAVTFVLFPVVTKAAQQGDIGQTRAVFRSALRFAFVLLGLMLSVLAGAPHGVLRVVYPSSFFAGASALRWLALGQACFALLVLGLTVVLAMGRTLAATGVMVTTLFAVMVGNLLALQLVDVGSSSLVAAALATAAGCLVGLVLTLAYLTRLLGTFVPVTTAVRATACAVVSAIVAGVLPSQSKVHAVGTALVTVLVFVATLMASGELHATERAALVRRFRRR